MKINGLQNESDGPKRRARSTGTHYVYLIVGAHGFVKIGHSGAPNGRLSELQVGSPHRLHLAKTWRMNRTKALTVERICHDVFAWAHVRGEWHTVTEREAETVLGLLANEDIPAAEAMAAMIHRLAEARDALARAKRRPYYVRNSQLRAAMDQARIDVPRLDREHSALRAEALRAGLLPDVYEGSPSEVPKLIAMYETLAKAA